jgi:hypothetical protein
LIAIQMDLPGCALVGSRTGSSGQFEADRGRLESDLKLIVGYVVEDGRDQQPIRSRLWSPRV